jgi:hypothetical protein
MITAGKDDNGVFRSVASAASCSILVFALVAVGRAGPSVVPAIPGKFLPQRNAKNLNRMAYGVSFVSVPSPFDGGGPRSETVVKSTRIGFLHSAFPGRQSLGDGGCILHFFQFSLDKN